MFGTHGKVLIVFGVAYSGVSQSEGPNETTTHAEGLSGAITVCKSRTAMSVTPSLWF